MRNEIYQSPLATRYASQEMSTLFSPQFKYSSWRTLWVVLAEAEKELGLEISKEQINELKASVENIDFKRAAEYEEQLGHDVMAHILTYAEQCPKAAPIIHLGATSCFVTDNTEIIQMHKGLSILISKLKVVMRQLGNFAKEHAHLACLSFTHFQAAQPTTVGKRACIWLQDLLLDLKDLQFRYTNLSFLGVKGTTGTQASFVTLFDGDQEKVKLLDHAVAKKMGFESSLPISGQTYTRKQDAQILAALAGIGSSAHKIATDLRLLAHLKEIEEPFKQTQVGSSAMPYKRNPILSERICGLSRFLISLSENPSYTAATQWLERSLDDSANRRLAIPEAFLTCDSILELLKTVTSGLIVYPQMIARHLAEELPFMATENILMESVKKGGDRQALHEKLRTYSQEVGEQIKQKGHPNTLLEKILSDSAFKLTLKELEQILDIKKFVGRSPEQVEEFLKSQIYPNL